MEIKDKFKDGLVFQEGGTLSTIPKNDKIGVFCLLCGRFVQTNIPLTPRICWDCKELWRKLKENEK